ncbi:MAG TPA: hypothetical protein VMY38_02905, partial [Gemmatimonadaceae bacterium]|nr:hypothetical protein [Gemmatimonadaceae bacterium]
MPNMRKLVTFAILIAGLAPAAAQSQQPAPAGPAQRPQKKSAMKIEPWIAVEGEYDNNTFLLAPSRKRALDDPSAADLASGRFTGMESSDDLIVRARAGIGIELDGPGGRPFTISPALRYDYYTKNDERSNLTATVALAQAFARGMRTRFEAAYTPSYFPKSYLLDAVDANSDRVIAPQERRYAPAEYSELDVELAHRLRLRKSTKRSPLELDLDLGAGYYARSYEPPFASRDLSGPTFRSTLGIAPGRRADFTLGYDLELLSADEGQEVLVLNEADAGRDLNANGNATDLSVRTLQLVDRSRREHELSAGARFDVARRTDLRLG